MYNKQRKNSLIPVIIILIIVAIIVQAVLNSNNISMKSIISGKEIAKNKATLHHYDVNWIKDMAELGEYDQIGEYGIIEMRNNGIAMSGTHETAVKNAIYFIPESQKIKTFSFDYNIEHGHSMNWGGILLGIKQEENILKGYLLTLGLGQDTEIVTPYFCTISLWKLEEYPLNDNICYYYENNNIQNNNIKMEFIKGWGTVYNAEYDWSGNITISYNSDQIIIDGKDVLTWTGMSTYPDQIVETDINYTIDASEENNIGNGVGFCVSTQSHNCERGGTFELTNIAIEVEDIEPYNLYINPNGGTWNDSSEVSTIEGEYGDEVEIPLPTRPGYNFAGWTQTGNSGTMSSLTEDAIYTFGEDFETDDTLIAQWTKIEVEKSYNIDTGEVRRKRRYNRTSKLRNRK